MHSRLRFSCALSAVLLACFGASAEARIKLITLPLRERVEIQLDHPGATLVEEERIVPLVKGDNEVDFSWANTQINPDTIVFRVVAPLGKDLEAKVLSVSYPPGESALVWSVSASGSGSARVRISYLLGNLSKTFNYRAVASHDERTLALGQYLRVQNLGGEEFGKTELWAGFGERFMKPIGVGETKEMLMERYEQVPVKKTYTCDVERYGYLDQPQNKLRVPMHYVLKNDKANHLGQAALPAGKVRIFIRSADDKDTSTAFLGEDWGKFTPLDDEMKLYLGMARDIVVRRTIEKSVRRRVAGNLFDQEVVVKFEIENFKPQAVALDVAENLTSLRSQTAGSYAQEVQWELGSETTFTGGLDAEESTFDRLVFHAELSARDADQKARKTTHKLHIILKNQW